MFLRSLTLKGFKSFADPTTLELEPGLTAVVGPNGSGKSNIVDAVAWVLGAQGPRSVRSTRMDDVIFAGTGRRSALGRAEVTLTIDNTSGLLPIGLSEVTITRTLFRTSGESEYAINGAPCRLLDVQELLSDTGVGRQQHVIVSQGNLDAVLDARPEDRRLIIEEAAGILKFRRRKEKAERRLEATEANLVRLADLNREVGRQLKPLERQADAARRHDALADELRALRLHLAGRELAALAARQQAATTARTRLGADETSIKVELRGLDSSVAAAEAWVASAGGTGLGEALGRLEALRERARGLAAVLTERRRSLGRERAVAVDASVISALESEAARLAVELAEVTTESGELAPLRSELAEAEAAVARELEALAMPTPRANRAAEARGELAAVRTGAERGRAEMARLRARLLSLETQASTLDAQRAARQAEVDGLAVQEQMAVAGAAQADARRVEALAGLETARAGARETAAAERVWAARAEALALALAESAGADRLAGVTGVLGPLAGLVEVDCGWEDAWAAAAAELAHTIVVDGVGAARKLLAGLDGANAGILALGAPAAALHGVPAGCPGEPLRGHVRSSHPGIERALDILLAGTVVVTGGWAEALDVSLAHPEIVALTRSGDRFGVTAWRRGNTGTAATRVALDEARTQAEVAVTASAGAAARLAEVGVEADEAATVARTAAQGREAAVRAARAARGELERAQVRRREALAEAEGVGSHLDQLARRLAHEESRIQELAELLPVLEAEETAGAAEATRLGAARAEVTERMSALRSRRTGLDMRATGLGDRRAYLSLRLTEVEDRLARHGAERAAAGAVARRSTC